MKRTAHKLQLHSETLRQLGAPDLLEAAGGITQRVSGCPAQHSLCFDPFTGCL